MTWKDSSASPYRKHRTASWLAVLFLLSLAFPSAGRSEEPALDEPARFLIESIVVEGVERTAAREIVAKETRIVPGSTVDEDQLRLAIYRVRRLPFVVDADFSLRKGSERGRYGLVIRIEMASSIFADLSAGAAWERGEPGGGELDYFGTIGARQFVGSRGYAFGSIDRFRNLQVGYTRFHLFGPGSFFSAAVGTNLEAEGDAYDLSISAGKPLTASQSLRADLFYRHSELFEDRSGSLEWRSDTTDDPLLPTVGERFSVQAGYGTSDFRFRSSDGTLSCSENRNFVANASARRYWSLAPRHSIWGEVAVAYSDNRFSTDGARFGSSVESGTASVGYSWDLLRSRVGEPRNDLRLDVRTIYSAADAGANSGIYDRALSLETVLTYRRPQGSISLGFVYLDSRRPRFNP